ncbi:MAG: carboxypeptidase regulatory-like domain-containing protein [Holophagales bacterium]|nr:MAG: carboxypeptidase regulatory-like domain-containing protein [Holophagales bacterium]
MNPRPHFLRRLLRVVVCWAGLVSSAGMSSAVAGPAAPSVAERESLRQQTTELRRELWHLEEMLALTPLEVGEAITGAEARRAEIERALRGLATRLGTRSGIAPDAASEELLRARGELDSLQARIERRAARRSEVGPQLPSAPTREPGDLEIVATSTHTTCETALELGSTRVRGIVRPEVWFRVRVPKATNVAIRAEALDESVSVTTFSRCGGEALASSGSPLQNVLFTTSAGYGDLWIRLASRSQGSRRHNTFTIDAALDVGSISGRVTRADNGVGVSTQVQAYVEAGWSYRTTYSNEDGQYSIPDLPPGSYRVVVPYGGDLVGELFDNHHCAGGPPFGCSVASGDPVVVQDSTTTPGIDFQLVVGGHIVGRVRLVPEGTPPDSATVRILTPGGQDVAYDLIDPFGRYAISGLQGEYRAIAGASGREGQVYDHVTCVGPCSAELGTPIVVGPGDDRTDVDFDLPRLGAIAGQVLDSLGSPIPGATVGAYAVSTGGFIASATSSADGAYLIESLPAGLYTVTARPMHHEAKIWGGATCTYSESCFLECSAGTPVSVSPLLTTADVDFSLRPFQSIGGSVRREENGAPLAGVIVANGNGFYCQSTWGESNVAGEYRLEAVPPQGHRLRTSNSLGRVDEVYDGFNCGPNGCSSTGLPFTSVPVNLDAPTEGIDFSLALGASIHGFVRDSQGQGVSVCGLGGAVRLLWNGGAPLDDTCSGADGAFTFDTLAAGSYLVEVHAPSYNSERWDNVPCQAFCTGGTPISIAQGEERHGIDVALDHAGWIRGTALSGDSARRCWSSASIAAMDAGGAVVASGYARDDGSFLLTVPSAAPVYVTATAGGCERSLFPGLNCPGQIGVDCLLASGTPISVGLNQVAENVNFSLRAAPSLRGRVLQGPDGRPAPGVVVDAFLAADHTSAGSVQSGADGSYLLLAGAPGTGLLVATDNGVGAVDELWQNVPCPNGPAWLGLCDLNLATPIPLREYEVVTGIDFVLSGWPVFKNGFENGSLVGWGGSVSN